MSHVFLFVPAAVILLAVWEFGFEALDRWQERRQRANELAEMAESLREEGE